MKSIENWRVATQIKVKTSPKIRYWIQEKHVLCDDCHALDDCQFYNKISIEERSKFFKENKLCYDCYEGISTLHIARSSKNRKTSQVYMDLSLKGKENPIMMVLMLMIQLL